MVATKKLLELSGIDCSQLEERIRRTKLKAVLKDMENKEA